MPDPRVAWAINAARHLARWRWVGVPVLGAVAAWTANSFAPADFAAFGILGRAVLHGHVAAAYASSFDESGPLQLIAAALVPLHATASPAMQTIEICWGIAIAVGAMVLVRALRGLEGHRPSPEREVAAGVAAALLVVAGNALTGHLAELAVPLAWIFAATTIRQPPGHRPRFAARGVIRTGHTGRRITSWAAKHGGGQRGRWVVAGLLLGTAVAVEPWAVLGLPVVLLADRLKTAAAAAGVALTTATCCYLPFVLAGPFRMLEHRWPVEPGTLVHVIWPDAIEFGWLPRLLQALVCLAVGSALALALRRRNAVNACWLVPLGVLLARILLDPVQFDYYWVAPQIALLAGFAFIEQQRHAAVTGTALWLVSYPVVPTLAAIAGLAVVITLAIGELRHQPRVANRWSTGRSSTLMPTMASPSPRDTFAITSGSS